MSKQLIPHQYTVEIQYTNGMRSKVELSSASFTPEDIPRVVREVLNQTSEDFDYDQLDPGIRNTVRWVHSLGYQTSDSGDGVSKPESERELHFPHVVIPVPASKLIEVTDAINGKLRELVTDPDVQLQVVAEATYSEGHALVLVVNLHDGLLPE